MYPALFFLDAFLIVLSLGGLGLAALLGGGLARRHRAAGIGAALLVAGAALLATARVAVLLGLASYGPEFGADRLALGLPLALLPLLALIALPGLWPAGRDRPVAGPVVPRAAGIVAVRTAAVAAVLSWHLAVVPAVSVPATAAVYAVVLAVAAAAAALWSGRRAVGRRGRTLRVAASGLAIVVGLAGLVAWSDRSNRPPAEYPALAGTPVDAGGGPVAGHSAHLPLGPGVRSVADLRGPAGPPDRRFTLTARRDGDRWTYDGTVPGPELRMTEGELVEVTLVNRDVPGGVTLHWHGLDVPNAEDGVAGVTQDAVPVGGRHVYRFRPAQVGTFWYHSHQLSSEQVGRGLLGVLVVGPRSARPAGSDLAVVDHPRVTSVPDRRAVPAGTPVRLRILNADNRPTRYTLAGTPARLVAIDGTDLSGPAEVADLRVRVGAGGRYDVAFTMPDTPVRLTGGKRDLELSADGQGGAPRAGRGGPVLDPLSYGTPAGTPFGPDSRFDRDFRLVIDQRLAAGGLGLGYHWSINGRVWPDLPALTVREGDLVRTRIVNRSTAEHPMHLHGHHMLVLSRGGVRSTGSPWWTDTLTVSPGETYEVAFRADNPGIWMDHCHDLRHARAGFVLHLAYEGIGTPFRLGEATGNAAE